MPETDCLVIGRGAEGLVEAVRSSADECPEMRTCTSAEAALESYDGEEVLLGDPRMIADVIDRLAGVRWVQSTWAGIKPLLEPARRDYVLTGIKDVFGPQMSEYVFGYLLAHELRIAERQAAQRERQWLAEHSGTLVGKTIGIMGTGSIGAHIAQTSAAFGMTALGLSASGAAKPEFHAVYKTSRLTEFLSRCDYLVSTLPETPATEHLLDRSTLGALPAHAVFVNVGRSNVVDDEALVEALQLGNLAGAVLDVFDEEPLPAGSTLWNAPNMTITAHVAAVSHPSLIAPIFVDNLRRFRNGETLRYVVDFERGY